MPKKASSIEQTINYHAKDSINFDVKTKKAHLYGDAHVDYGEIELDANYITINWQDKTVLATYTLDSNGNKIGVPIFKDGGDVFNVDTVKYNWQTKKGYITDLLTKQSGGFMSSDQALKDSSGILYAKDAEFCPCLDSTAGTYIKSKKIKVIPDKRVYTGPFLLHVEDIPLPLGGPFGMFPISSKKSSGIIIPQYGERVDRGFSLSEGGFYWAVNDYIGAKVLGEIYTKGGWGLSLITNYKKRYSFDGNFKFSYRKIVENGDEINREEKIDYTLNWYHAPQTRGSKSFSADVNFATTTYNRNNETQVDDYLKNTLTSNIRYSFPIKKLFNATMSFRHEQNNIQKTINLTLPELTVGLKNRIYPFKKKGSSNPQSNVKQFFRSINLNYTMLGKNKISNSKPNFNLPFEIANLNELDTAFLDFSTTPIEDLLKRSQFGFKHSIPISGVLKLGPFNIEGRAQYNEYWVPDSWDYDVTTDTSVSLSKQAGFNRFSDYSLSSTLRTNIYGKFYSKKIENGKNKWAIRQRITPNISYSYSPDYSAESNKNDYYQTVVLQEQEYNVSRFQNTTYTPRNAGLSRTLGFGIGSAIEMKRYAKGDTTGKPKYIKLLENINIGSGYNFAKDSLNLSDISVNANTRLFNLISINFRSSFNPYTQVQDSNGNTVKINKFRLNTKNELAYMDNMNITLSTSLNPKVFKKGKAETDEDNEYLDRFLAFNPDAYYIDYKIPWNLRINYSYDLKRFEFKEAEDARKAVQSLRMSGDLSLTEKWKFTYSASYDIETKKFVYPNMGVSRDLNCWEMRMTWVPFGPATQYRFFINIKSAMLKDVLKYKRKNDYRDAINF